MLTSNSTPLLSEQQTILIVEDEFAVANDLRQILEKAGYYVSGSAFTVAEALEINQRVPPDLVLLDIQLQGPRTGIDLARQLNTEQIPFVYISANTNASTLEEANATQSYGFIVKPFRERDVLVALEIARYRHAHSVEVRMRKEHLLQIALTDALSAPEEWEQRLLKVARLFQPHIPFTYLIMGLKEDPASSIFRACSLLQTGPDEYQTIWLNSFMKREGFSWDKTIQILDQHPYEAATRDIGEDFEAVCRRNPLKQLLAKRFNLRSNVMLPLQTAQNGSFYLSFYSAQPDTYQPEHLAMLERLEPSLTLTLDRLLAFDKIESREQIKTTELAIVTAFTSGKPYPEIIRDVARALNQTIPCDLLSVYRAGMALEGSSIDATVIRKEGAFVDFSLLDLLPSPDELARWQNQLDEVGGLFDDAAMYLGSDYARISNHNEITRLYSETLGLKCCLIVPIHVKGARLASVVLASKTPFFFTEKDFALFQQVSLQMALGIENRMTFHRIQSLTEQLKQENTYLLEEVKTAANYEEIIGESPLLLHVFKSIGQVAPTDYSVLVLGETGTGKELIARAIHNRSGRHGKALIKVNCAALPPQLIESELFGHEKGSFTGATDKRIGKFELAHGGTIFLDEIGELPLELQPKLLRVLQEKEIERIGGRGPIPCDVRIIAATNRHLQEEVSTGRFRADLYYRLNVFPIMLPPLRDRKEDLPMLATYFLQKIAKNLGKKLTGISETSVQQMQAYHWPGNIRELEHLLQRAAIMATGPIISLVEPLVAEAMIAPQPPLMPKPHDQAERENVLAALRLTNFRIRGKDGAAALLNIKPTTLEAQIVRLGIKREDYL